MEDKRQYTASEENHMEISETTAAPVRGFDEKAAAQMAPIFGRFLKAYEESDGEVNPAWLEALFAEELPGRTEEEIHTLRQEIQDSVARWDADMASLQDACAEGKSKEEWLEGKLQEATVGANVEDYGDYLALTHKELHQSNQEAIEEISGEKESGVTSFREDGEAWDAQNTHELALQIGREAEASSLVGTVLRTGWDMAEALPIGEEFKNLKKVGDALRNGEDQGVKEAASAALKAGIEKGYIPVLPKETPTAVITGLACTGVEQAKILLQFADGDISGGQALNLMGRVATVNAANACAYFGQQLGSKVGRKVGMAIGTVVGTVIPVLAPVGAVIGSFVGGVVGKIGGSMVGNTIKKAANKIAEKANPVLVRLWEDIKSVGRSIANAGKKILSLIFD